MINFAMNDRREYERTKPNESKYLSITDLRNGFAKNIPINTVIRDEDVFIDLKAIRWEDF